MLDHVTIRVTDLEASGRFYRRALELVDFPGAPTEGEGFEWNDFSIAPSRPDRPPTRRLHIAFQATSRAMVDAWWAAMTEAGYQDDGPPGPRPQYSPDYYGAFVLDPDGNSVEAVDKGRERHDGVIDHLWLRVRLLAEATRFYETIAPIVSQEVSTFPDRTRIHSDGASFSLVEGEPTENVHIAFPGPRPGHRRGLPPGRDRRRLRLPRRTRRAAVLPPGYYGAYLADPDGNNIEAVFHGRPRP